VGTHAPDSARTFAWIQLPPAVRDRLASYLLERGVYTTFKYWPLHRMRLYRDGRAYPGADAAADSTLLLPLHHGLTDGEVERVVTAISLFAPERQYRT
jgi:aminotransferase